MRKKSDTGSVGDGGDENDIDDDGGFDDGDESGAEVADRARTRHRHCASSWSSTSLL